MTDEPSAIDMSSTSTAASARAAALGDGPGHRSSENDTARIAALVAALEHWVPRLLDEPDRAAAIVAACRIAAADSTGDFARRVTAIERAAHTHSRHLLLFVDPAGALVPDGLDDHVAWSVPDMRGIRRRAGGVAAVTRTNHGIATIRVDSLEPFDVVEQYFEAAYALIARCTGLIVDLRVNGGGDPATVASLAGFILGPEAVALSSVHGLEGVTEWSTIPPAARLCLASEVPVSVLTSSATFSSAEALAYHLQVRGRVTIVGERTPGAADHVAPVVLTSDVHAQLPIARVVDAVTGSSWEGAGVLPDVECPSFDAELVAVERIRVHLSRSSTAQS